MTLSPPLPSTRRADSLKVIATNRWEEVRPCLSLIHDGFVEAGFTEEHPSGLRVIPEYLNPGTIFFLCRDGDEPVGTMVWVPDGPAGVPSDRAFHDDIDRMRVSRGVTENTSFTVKKDARRMTRHISLRLFAAGVRLADRLDLMLTSVMPNNFNFYRDALGFSLAAHCDDLFGAPAAMLRVDGAVLKSFVTDPLPSPQCRAIAELANSPDGWFTNHVESRIAPARELTELAVRMENIF